VRVRSSRFWCGLLLAGATAPVAAADVYTIPDGYAGPRPVQPSGVNPRATPATGEFVCDASTHIGDPSLRWTSIAATPAGYVVGSCLDGWKLRRTFESAWVANEKRYYEGGLIAGEFADCGWIPGDRVTQVGEYKEELCSTTASHSVATYGRVFNSEPGSYGDGTNREGDYVLVSTGACPEFANLRPWDPGAIPANYLRTRLPGYDKFYWRYVAVNPDVLPWVMVRDAGVASGGGNWVFVPRHCLPERLPYGQGGPWVPPAA
jgi:hypothetical protein